MQEKNNVNTGRYVGSGLCFGVAIGSGLGVAFSDLALGMGPGIAIGAALGLIAARQAASKQAESASQRPDA